jgi:glycosyltransferase involved in cell wall biosynthesis
MEAEVTATPGVEQRGFIQPAALPALMAEAGAFVLPSLSEPWGVVLQEAAAAGLPLISTEACGAAVHLLRDGHNGYLVSPENVDELAARMHDLAMRPADERTAMGARSFELSRQYTPDRWARTLLNGIPRLQSQ